MSNQPDPISIPAYVFAVFEARLEEISKKARRLGTPEPTVTILDKSLRTVRDEHGNERDLTYVTFTLDAPTPILEGGWRFVAAIEHHDAGNLIRVAPDFQNEELGLRDADSMLCDHCGTKRARAKTLLLQNADGERKRVGSACVKDYLGHAIPNVWAIWSALDDLRDELNEGGFGMGGNALDVDYALVIAAQLTLTDGFKPASFGGESTKHEIESIMSPRGRSIILTDDAKTLARDARAWITAITDGSDYEHNLRIALEVADRKHLGLIASLPAAYLKHRDRELTRVRVEEKPAAPCVYGKQTVTGAVLKAYAHHNDYGTRWVMLVQDDRGFTVWGTIPTKINPEIGDRVRFDCTIEASDKPEFGFFKRPTKAEILETEKVA